MQTFLIPLLYALSSCISIHACNSPSSSSPNRDSERLEIEARVEAEKNYSALHDLGLEDHAEINPDWLPKYSTYKKMCDGSYGSSYQRLSHNIPGLRLSNMSDELAHEVLHDCPKEIKDMIYKIEHDIFDKYEKNIILTGFAGLGKSAIAEAIAKKCSTSLRPITCFLVDAEAINTSFINSGVQNLEKIFELAAAHQPCVVVLDELEALTNKHINKHSDDNNVLIALWKRLDKYSKDKIVFIGTMNSSKNLPVQISSRAQVLKLALPGKSKIAEILQYYMCQEQMSKEISFASNVTLPVLVNLVHDFSPREIQRFMAQIAFDALMQEDKLVMLENCVEKANKIKQAPARKKERWADTWMAMISRKNAIRAGQCLVAVAGVAAVGATFYFGYTNQQMSLVALEQNKIIAEQSKKAAQESLKLQACALKLTKTNAAIATGGVIGGGAGAAIGAGIGAVAACIMASPAGPGALIAGGVGAKTGAAIGGSIGASLGAMFGLFHESIGAVSLMRT